MIEVFLIIGAIFIKVLLYIKEGEFKKMVEFIAMVEILSIIGLSFYIIYNMFQGG